MSVLNESSLKSFFQGGAQSLKAVLFYGQDDGLIDECRRQAVKIVTGQAQDPFCRVELKSADVSADVSALFAEANAISLMGGRRVIEIRDADNKLAGALKDYLSSCKSDALIVVTAGSLQKESALRKLFEKAENAGVFACYADDGDKLKRFVAQTLAENGLQASPDVVSSIADNLGADRMMSRSELTKLAIYMGDRKQVEYDDVAACIGDASVLSIDNFLYALSGGQVEESQKVLEKLYAEGQSPIGLLRMASSHFKRFHLVQSKIARGEAASAAMNALYPKIHFKRTADFQSGLRFWSLPKIARALDLLTQTETRFKSKNIPQNLLCSRTFLLIARLARR